MPNFLNHVFLLALTKAEEIKRETGIEPNELVAICIRDLADARLAALATEIRQETVGMWWELDVGDSSDMCGLTMPSILKDLARKASKDQQLELLGMLEDHKSFKVLVIDRTGIHGACRALATTH